MFGAIEKNFNNHGSFRKTIHTISKHLMLEDGDDSRWKDPDATFCISDIPVTSSSDGPACKHEIEWENSDVGKEMRVSGCLIPDKIDNNS